MSEDEKISTDTETVEKEEKQPLKKKKRGKASGKEKDSKNKSNLDSSNGDNNEKVKKKSKGSRKHSGLDHPRTVDMIIEAIENLEDRNGSSVQAIKSYITNNFKVPDAQFKSMVKRALANALKDNLIVRPKNQANNSQLMSGRYLIRKKTAEEIEPPKPRPSQLRQFKVVKGKKNKMKKKGSKKRRRKSSY